MTKNTEKPEPEQNDDQPEFDMYRFFSRYDVIAIAIIIVGLLLYTLYTVLMVPASPV
jgi:hypothetical protein